MLGAIVQLLGHLSLVRDVGYGWTNRIGEAGIIIRSRVASIEYIEYIYCGRLRMI
jgi:hypothetical protein